MSAPFTPPPWDITKGAYGALHVGPARLDHPGRARVEYAQDHGGHDLLARREADARLIHAVHDMLAALKLAVERLEVSNFHGDEDDSLEVIYAAIAKAEGGAA